MDIDPTIQQLIDQNKQSPEVQRYQQALTNSGKSRENLLNELKKPEPVPVWESGLRGAGSGFLMGLEPQVEAGARSLFGNTTPYSDLVKAAQDRNEQAYQQNKGAYGLGYGTGAVGLGALTGGLGLEARGATAATEALAQRAAAQMAGRGSGQEAVNAAAQAVRNAAQNPSFLQRTQFGPRNILTNPASAGNEALRYLNSQGNKPQDQGMGPGTTPQPDNKKTSSIDFGKLSGYLDDAANSNNPQVAQQAQQIAQQLAQGEQLDPDEQDKLKRQLAMLSQRTPAGRATMNTDNPYNDIGNDALT